MLPRTADNSTRAGGLPWRAVVLGAVLLPPLTLFGLYSYIIVQTATWMGDTMLRGPVFLLFLLTLLSLGLRRVSRRWALRREELLLIYAMTSLGTALCGVGWAMFVVPSMSGGPKFFAEHGQTAWATWLDLIPRWFMVQDAETFHDLWEGHSTLYTARHLRALLLPGLTWTAFMLLLVTALQCLAELVRRQWIERERLTFPLTYLPLEMAQVERPAPFWKNRLMWAGFFTAAFIESLNSVHYLYPAVPEIHVKVTRLPVPAVRPWNGLGSIWIAFYPFVIGIGYLLSLDISLSIWLFFVLTRVQDVIALSLGFRDRGGWSVNLPPYHLKQDAGAFIVLALLVLWRCRRDFLAALRGLLFWSAGRETPRWAVVGLLVTVPLMLFFWTQVGIPLWVMAAALGLYLLYATTVSRLVAESGTPSAMAPISPQEVLFSLAGVDLLTKKQLVAFAWFRIFDERFYDNPAIHQLTTMRLLQDSPRGRRGVHLALTVAAVVGILGGLWALLHIYFAYGLASAQVRGWPSRSVAQIPFRLLQAWLDQPRGPEVTTITALAAGAVVMAGLMFLRQRVLWWPIHPIGYAMAGNWAMQELWFPFFVAWMLKWLTLRYGGMRLYRRVLPFFLGLILGDYILPLCWAIYGVLIGQQMYLAYPH
ncbi:MAG TPA: hypothetical protein EYP85_17150 [Armatimonadetes bacterium]|nr:hypothetical protein [Armatimonadota bacterium]